jgi:outer membrane protein assembly factor BamB
MKQLKTSGGWKLVLVSAVSSLFFLPNLPAQDLRFDWKYFRGSGLNGISENAGLPLHWSESTNIIWKQSVHDRGISSPVVFDNQVWITTASKDGKKLYAVCLDLNSGKVIHDILVFEPENVYGIHALNSYATPTPAIEEGAVYVHFGSMGTACIDTKTADILWKRTDLKCDHVQGPASCPVIYKDLLILHYEGVDIQYIVALNKRTGEMVWKSIRPQEYYVNEPPIARKAYSTPIFIHLDGKDLMISSGSEVCIAYDPLTGKEIWRIVYSSDSAISMPVYENGVLIISTGYHPPVRLMAVNPEGSGNISETNILWRYDKNIPGINSPVAHNGLLYMIQEEGKIQCVDVKTGQVIWTNHLKGNFYSSPIYAAGHIYLPSKQGIIYVLQEGKEFTLLAENKLDSEIWSSMAISGKSILLRSDKAVYRIENP